MLPLSIGDGELCETALTTVPVPEIFRYWLQGGRITVGFLGGAQVDRFGNLNTTVIGNYARPKVRLPGSGGATEIATSCGQIFIVMRQGPRSFVRATGLSDFARTRTDRPRTAGELGIRTKGPTLLVTDLCVMRPDAETNEMTVHSIHPGITREHVMANTALGCAVRRSSCRRRRRPLADELEVLRDLHARTARAHGAAGRRAHDRISPSSSRHPGRDIITSAYRSTQRRAPAQPLICIAAYAQRTDRTRLRPQPDRRDR